MPTQGGRQPTGPVSFPGFAPTCCAFEIQVTADFQDVEDSSCVYITDEPALPDLEARVSAGQLSQSVDWSLVISYTRSGRNDWDTISATLGPSDTWQISFWMGNMIRGGQATISCYSPELGCSQYRTFAIRGYNPPKTVVDPYLEAPAFAPWYNIYVAEHESGVSNSGNSKHFNEDLHIVRCQPSDTEATPNASYDGGFGLFQLTRFDDPERVPNAHGTVGLARERDQWHGLVGAPSEWIRHIHEY